MATATAKFYPVIPVPRPEVETVTLVLTAEEAQVLRDIFYVIGGTPRKAVKGGYSRRILTDGISMALHSCGITRGSRGNPLDLTGSLHFKDI